MNRRNFLRRSALAVFGFAVLPPAETYQRIWRASTAINPAWVTAPYSTNLLFDAKVYLGAWTWTIDANPIRFTELAGVYRRVYPDMSVSPHLTRYR